MKLSILTATYNRANLLKRLYESILINLKVGIEVEWLIMDDGSSDETENVISKIRDENKIRVMYLKQVNQGKMAAINHLMDYARGDLIIECDSDDYFAENAFLYIKDAYEESRYEKDLYALSFLKYDQNGNNIGNDFKERKTTMFDLYFKQQEDGEKAVAFFKDRRREYSYELEGEEKFITEARMYHKMDLKYKIKCYNEPVMVCEYQKDGYSKNINEVFKKNPKGYLKYFKEILTEHSMVGVQFNKRLYVIKHYILFCTLNKVKPSLGEIKGFLNKVLIVILYIPGFIMTKKRFR
ncbi:MAG: glycosyltransferase family 2 protein [Clostridia bacterium]